MMQRIKQTLVAFALVMGMGVLLAPQPAAAINLFQQGCQGQSSEVCNSARTDNATDMVKDILNVLFFVIGILAVIMIIIGGFRYVLSNGDAGSVTAAKNTIFYAVVGLAVAILSYVIVNFVIGALNRP